MRDLSILCRGVSCGYELPRPVVRVPLLEAFPGEITAFCGGNGTGKTTLLKVLAELLTPWEGEVIVRGGAAERLSVREVQLNSVYVHQEPYILKGTVYQNLALFLPRRRGLRREGIIAGSLELLGLGGREKDRAFTLSGGEKKRLALARALAARKGILLLDEPTANVDARSTEVLAEKLRELKREGMTIVLATHDEAFAAALADRVYLFGGGTVRRGETLRLKEDPPGTDIFKGDQVAQSSHH